MRNGGEPLLLLRELAALGAECIACHTADLPPLDEINPSQGYLGWSFRVPAGVSEAVTHRGALQAGGSLSLYAQGH